MKEEGRGEWKKRGEANINKDDPNKRNRKNKAQPTAKRWEVEK